MSELWQAVGDAEAARPYSTPLLGREESRRDLEAIFEEWSASPKSRSAWKSTSGTAGYWKALPAKVRLVARRKTEIAFTDETGDGDDPPVRVMRKEERPLQLWHKSYTEWFVWAVLTRLTNTRSAEYNPRAELTSTAQLDGLYPSLHQLDERVWWMQMPAFARKDEVPANTRPLFYASLADYFRFVRELPDDKIAFMRNPIAATFTVETPGSLDICRGTPPGFRGFKRLDFQGRPTHFHCAVGAVAGVDVWLSQIPKGDLFVYHDPRQRDAVLAWLSRMKVDVSSETPLREGYDKWGW